MCGIAGPGRGYRFMKSSDQTSLGSCGASSGCIGLINRLFVRRGRLSFIGAIHPPDSLVVPRMTFKPQPVMAFPESPTAPPGNNRIERLNHRRIPHCKLVLVPGNTPPVTGLPVGRIV